MRARVAWPIWVCGQPYLIYQMFSRLSEFTCAASWVTSRRTRPAPNASHAIISSTAQLPARSHFEPRTTDSVVGLEMGANTRTVLRLFTHHLLVSTTRASLVNKTIDDTYCNPITGRTPVYLPNGRWNGQNRSGCAIDPNASLPFDGTWSAATYHSGTWTLHSVYRLENSFNAHGFRSAFNSTLLYFAGVGIRIYSRK